MAVAVVAGDLLRFRQVEWKGRPWLWQFALRPPLPLLRPPDCSSTTGLVSPVLSDSGDLLMWVYTS